MSVERPPRPPDNEDPAAWRAYWQAQDMPWRTEPEIDEGRQGFLDKRRAIRPDIECDIYPFKDIMLTRADVEWLLATHEDRGVRGPINLQEEQARWDAATRTRSHSEFKPLYERARHLQQRKGPDLRGAQLAGVDLSGLPLSRAGLRHAYLSDANMSGVELKSAVLSAANLRHAVLRAARAEDAQMDGADLSGADLTTAYLVSANLEGAVLRGATLLEANLENAHLLRVDLREADMTGVRLNMACLREADLTGATLRNAHQLRYADLTDAKGLKRRGRHA